MKATRNSQAEVTIYLTQKEVSTLEKTGLLEGILLHNNYPDFKFPLEIHYFKTEEDASRKWLQYEDNLPKNCSYIFYAIALTEKSLQRIKNKEVSCIAEYVVPLYIRQGWMGLEGVF